MRTNNLIYDFHRFEGEGGDGGSLGAEASAFLDSLGGEPKKQADPKPRVEYGKGSRPEGNGEPSQVGTDTDEGKSLEAEFAELIGKGGKFHDLYGKGISDAIQNRFKNHTDLQGKVDQYDNAIAPLMQKYGLESGDIEGLTNAIATDEDIYRAGAEEAGLEITQYMQNLKLQADAERGRQIAEAYAEQQRMNEMFSGWEQQADELKGSVPNFDLLNELQSNETFAKLLDNGVPVKDAFLATHAEDILKGFGTEASKQAQQDVVNMIQKRASRPTENGVRHAPAIERKSDPKSLTNDDMDEIFRRAEAGEKFFF